jgi:HSP90 family molecular chaperone
LQHGKSPEGERTQLLAKLLYETALLESGFQLNDNKAFNKRVYSLVKVCPAWCLLPASASDDTALTCRE